MNPYALAVSLTGQHVLIGVVALCSLVLIVTLAVAFVSSAHRKMQNDQSQLLADAQCFHDVGANKLALLVSELACFHVRKSVGILRSFLRTVRSRQDALNFFADMWYYQLDLRMADAGEREKIMKRIAVDLQSQQAAGLGLVKKDDSVVNVAQDTVNKVVS